MLKKLGPGLGLDLDLGLGVLKIWAWTGLGPENQVQAGLQDLAKLLIPVEKSKGDKWSFLQGDFLKPKHTDFDIA